jgi:hypothetical protein
MLDNRRSLLAHIHKVFLLHNLILCHQDKIEEINSSYELGFHFQMEKFLSRSSKKMDVVIASCNAFVVKGCCYR